MTNNKIYRLSDGSLWDISQACYVEDVPAGFEVIDLARAGGPADEAYLIRTLEFYDYPLGELGHKSAKWIRQQLKALDEEFLPPRTLAALVLGDSVAKAMFNLHETRANILREQLANLEGRVFVPRTPDSYGPLETEQPENNTSDNDSENTPATPDNAADNINNDNAPANPGNAENTQEVV